MKILPVNALSGRALAICLIFSNLANAGFKGSVSFLSNELEAHKRVVGKITEDTTACMEEDLKKHQLFFAKNGISPFYGDQTEFSRLSVSGKKAHIKKLGKNPELLSEMKTTSCIGYITKCMGKAFAKSGQQSTWSKIYKYLGQNDYDASTLFESLQKLGWKIYYWNPDISKTADWDKRDKEMRPTNRGYFWGYHKMYLSSVQKNKKYYFNKVDDIFTLTNFGSTTPQFLKDKKFYMLIAHLGFHVTAGSHGNVIEAHAVRQITDPRTVEKSEFNPLKGLGPSEGAYRSGIFILPP